MKCNECNNNPVYTTYKDESYCSKHFDELKYLQKMNDPDWIGMCGCIKENSRWIELCDEHIHNYK